MNKVISLDAWRKKKKDKELDELSRAVKELIKDIDVVPKPYHQVHGYDDIGLSYSSGIILEPNLSSCCSTLAWVSYILSGIGRIEEANEIDNIVIRLENVAKRGE